MPTMKFAPSVLNGLQNTVQMGVYPVIGVCEDVGGHGKYTS